MMSGLENILERIEKSATETANQIIAQANADAARITASGKEEAERQEAAINKQAQLDVASTNKRIQSAAEMTEKRIVLKAKQDAIDDVLAAAAGELKDLDDDEYFAQILNMGPKDAHSEDGIIKFSAKHRGRLPKGFQGQIDSAAAGKGRLQIAEEPANIDGGFILVYGDIEENCSFDALIDASKEELQDEIGKILFSD